jgi:hypothetical protein
MNHEGEQKQQYEEGAGLKASSPASTSVSIGRDRRAGSMAPISGSFEFGQGFGVRGPGYPAGPGVAALARQASSR